MNKCRDLTGKKFGKLTALRTVKNTSNTDNHAMWLCSCECGGEKIVQSHKLLRGDVKSCGCLFHRKSKTRLYRIWSHMKSRCGNESSDSYSCYGGRGIIVCDEWLNSFEMFYEWAVNNGYSDNLSIDRMDVNGNYEPSNCRWTTMKVQSNNRRTNRIISFDGKTKTVAGWASETGIKQNTLLYRLRRGWTVERALTEGVSNA